MYFSLSINTNFSRHLFASHLARVGYCGARASARVILIQHVGKQRSEMRKLLIPNSITKTIAVNYVHFRTSVHLPSLQKQQRLRNSYMVTVHGYTVFVFHAWAAAVLPFCQNRKSTDGCPKLHRNTQIFFKYSTEIHRFFLFNKHKICWTRRVKTSASAQHYYNLNIISYRNECCIIIGCMLASASVRTVKICQHIIRRSECDTCFSPAD